MSKVTSTKDQDQLLDVKTRLWIFDLATERQEVRELDRRTQEAKIKGDSPNSQGWPREELYERGAPLSD